MAESRRLSALLLRASTAFGWGAVAVAIVLSLLSVHVLPSGDYWVFVSQRSMGPAFEGVWAQNEYHLMLLPRLIFVLDEMAGWGGHYLLSLAAALFSLAAITYAGARSIAEDAGINPVLRWPLLAVIAALVFSTTHAEVVTEPQKLWIPLALAGCVLALHLCTRSCRGIGGRLDFVGAMAAAVVATVSGIVGLLCLPVLALLAIVLRGGPARLAGIAIVAAVAGALFFTHVTLPPPRGGLVMALADPLPVLLALGRFLGAPAARILSGMPLANPVAEVLGLGGGLLALWFWLAFLRAPRTWAPAALWLGVLALALIWGGSVSLRDALEPGPILSRYDLIVSLFWSALVVLGIRCIPRTGPVVLPTLALVLLILQPAFGLRARDQADAVAAMRIALAAGAADPAIESRKGYINDIAHIRPLLRARFLPPFDGETARSLGASMAIPKDANACSGRIGQSVALPDGGLRLLGHGGIPEGRLTLLIVDAEGKAVGVGERWRGPAGLFGHPQAADGWLAYAGPGARPPLRVFVGGDTPCLIPEESFPR